MTIAQASGLSVYNAVEARQRGFGGRWAGTANGALRACGLTVQHRPHAHGHVPRAVDVAQRAGRGWRGRRQRRRGRAVLLADRAAGVPCRALARAGVAVAVAGAGVALAVAAARADRLEGRALGRGRTRVLDARGAFTALAAGAAGAAPAPALAGAGVRLGGGHAGRNETRDVRLKRRSVQYIGGGTARGVETTRRVKRRRELAEGPRPPPT